MPFIQGAGGQPVVIDIVSRYDDRGTKRARKDMLFLGLGTLFFGMQLRRTFGGILQTGMKTFREITEATYGAQTAMTGLNAAAGFLAFTVGDALNTVLEPLMPTIIGLVDAIADFVQQHPEVVFIAIGGALAGIALQTFGTVLSFLTSLRGFGGAEGLAAKMNLQSIEGALGKIGKLAAGGFGLGLIFQGILDSTDSIAERIGNTLSGAGLILLSAGKAPGKAALLFGAGFALKAVEEFIQGDMAKGISGAITALGSAVMWYGLATGNPYAFAIGFTLQFIEPLGQVAVAVGDWMQKNVWDKLSGTQRIKPGNIPTGGTFGMKPTWAQDFILQPGGRLIKTDPQDTIVGSKGGAGMGNTYNISISNSIIKDRQTIGELASAIASLTTGRSMSSAGRFR